MGGHLAQEKFGCRIDFKAMLLKSVVAALLVFAFASPLMAADGLSFFSLERRFNGRIGVVAIETGTEQQLNFRGGERFVMSSTFKLLLAAQILSRLDRGKESLHRVVQYKLADLLEWAPVTAQHVEDGGMTIDELCRAAVQYSDNTAANLLLQSAGGPEGFTQFARSLGDKVTRLDRKEPALNTPVAGKEFDTTTPEAMAASVRKVVLGAALSSPRRDLLQQYLLGNTTGGARLKAGLPSSWKVADKTGTGDHGVTNDVGVLYPPGKAPIVVAAYLSGGLLTRAECDALLAEIARIIVARLAR